MVTKTATPPNAPPVTENPGSEHVESLQDIAALGAALDAPAPGQPIAPGTAAAVDTAQEVNEIAAALALLRAAALPFAPDHVHDALGQIWSDAQITQIAKAIVEVCQLHGWTVGDFFGEYGPYIQLCMALGLPALATLKILKMPPPQNATPRTDG